MAESHFSESCLRQTLLWVCLWNVGAPRQRGETVGESQVKENSSHSRELPRFRNLLELLNQWNNTMWGQLRFSSHHTNACLFVSYWEVTEHLHLSLISCHNIVGNYDSCLYSTAALILSSITALCSIDFISCNTNWIFLARGVVCDIRIERLPVRLVPFVH